jgi:hypothetical protein
MGVDELLLFSVEFIFLLVDQVNDLVHHHLNVFLAHLTSKLMLRHVTQCSVGLALLLEDGSDVLDPGLRVLAIAKEGTFFRLLNGGLYCRCHPTWLCHWKS